MSQPKKLDITYSDLHRKTISASSTEERKACYAERASGYEAYLIKIRYIAPGRVARGLEKFMREKAAKMQPNTPIRVVDLGCGTARCMFALSDLWDDESHPLHGIGVDFCPEMLRLADETGKLAQLVEADISKQFEIPEGQVHFLMSAGVFFDGNVSPQAMPFAFEHVEEGGYISISVRAKTFLENSCEYATCIEKANCVVIDNVHGYYFEENTDVMANYLLLRKVR